MVTYKSTSPFKVAPVFKANWIATACSNRNDWFAGTGTQMLEVLPDDHVLARYGIIINMEANNERIIE
jgi:hypothetical protein